MSSGMVTIDEALRSGLRRDSDAPRNTQALVSCKHLRTTPRGLKAFVPISQPMANSYITDTLNVEKVWPFPQLFCGKNETLLCGENSVFNVTQTSSGDWTAAQLTTYKPWGFTTADHARAIPKGGVWHFADFYKTWMLFNGACVVYLTPGPMAYWKVFVAQESIAKTGCVLKEGRALYGGFNPTKYYSSMWQTEIEAYLSNAGTFEDYIDYDANGPGSNWVWWSSIGGGDLLYPFCDGIMGGEGLATAQSGHTTDYDQSYPSTMWMDMLKRNEAGFRPMPFAGNVHQMVPFDSTGTVVVYGEDGIAALRAASDPVPTFGLHVFPETGVNLGSASRGAAGGGELGQVFVDESGVLWLIRPDLAVEKLGYQEYFEDMLGENIVVQYEPTEKEFWISDGTDTYLLTETGLCRPPWMVTSVSFAQGGRVGIRFDESDADSVEVITEAFDGGERGVWEIVTVRIATTDTDAVGWQVAVDYRFGKGDAWSRTTSVPVDSRGIARVKVSGIEFRIVLTHRDRAKADLERIELEMRSEGRNSIRKWIDA